MKISYNTWAYSSFFVWVPAYTLDDTIKRLARLGYDGIEIGAAAPHAYPPHLSKARRAQVRDLLEENGIQLSSMLPAPSGGPGNNPASPYIEERRATVEHYKELAELTAEWGGKTLIYLPGWIIFGTSRRQAWAWSREVLTHRQCRWQVRIFKDLRDLRKYLVANSNQFVFALIACTDEFISMADQPF